MGELADQGFAPQAKKLVLQVSNKGIKRGKEGGLK
jgi:hypothetical protein